MAQAMKRAKWISCGLLLGCLILIGFGCGSQPETAITIKVWDIQEAEAYSKWWSDYAKAFEAAHPDVHISIEVFETNAYKSKWPAAAIARTLPDVFYQTPGPEITGAYKEDKLLSLDQLIDPGRLSESARLQCSFDGKLYGLPLYYAPSFIYYNKTLFSRAGVDVQKWADPTQPSWEEFIAACEALKKAGITPIAMGNAEKWPALVWYWTFQNRYGGQQELLNAAQGNGSYQSPGFIRAGALTRQLAERGYLTDGYNGIGAGQKYSIWTQGTGGAMIYQGPWLLGHITDTAPKDFSYGFFHFPRFPDGNPDSQRDVVAGIDALWVSAKTVHPETVGAFLKGFTDASKQLDFVLATNSVSAMADIEPPRERVGDMVWQISAAMKQTGAVIPWWDVSLLPPKVSETMLNLSQKLLLGEISPEAFAAELDRVAGKTGQP